MKLQLTIFFLIACAINWAFLWPLIVLTLTQEQKKLITELSNHALPVPVRLRKLKKVKN